jgi:hypothetical protein
MCLLQDVFGNGSSKFAFLCPTEFLYDDGNKDIVRELLSRFKIHGYAITDLNPYFGEYAFCVCNGRGFEEVEDSGIFLKKMRIVDGDRQISEKSLLYTHTEKGMLEYINEISEFTGKVPYDRDGRLVGWVRGNEKALGYFNFGRDTVLSTLPLEKTKDLCRPITKSTLFDSIAYYGMCQSNEECGLFTDIHMFVAGHSEYLDMVYNCLPVFLFDVNSEWRGYRIESGGESKLIKNKFDLESPIVKSLLETAEVHFSFEAKELMSFCRCYYDAFDGDRSLKTFGEIRDIIGDETLDKRYYNALRNLKKYISSTFRGVC